MFFHAEKLNEHSELEQGIFMSLEKFIPYRKEGWSANREVNARADEILYKDGWRQGYLDASLICLPLNMSLMAYEKYCELKSLYGLALQYEHVSAWLRGYGEGFDTRADLHNRLHEGIDKLAELLQQ